MHRASLPGPIGRPRELFEAMTMIARTGQGPREQLPPSAAPSNGTSATSAKFIKASSVMAVAGGLGYHYVLPPASPDQNHVNRMPAAIAQRYSAPADLSAGGRLEHAARHQRVRRRAASARLEPGLASTFSTCRTRPSMSVPFSDLIRIPPPAANTAPATSDPMSSASPAWPASSAHRFERPGRTGPRTWSRASRCVATMSSASSPPIPTSPERKAVEVAAAQAARPVQTILEHSQRRQPVQPGRGAGAVIASSGVCSTSGRTGTTRRHDRKHVPLQCRTRRVRTRRPRTDHPLLMQRIATPTRHCFERTRPNGQTLESAACHWPMVVS